MIFLRISMLALVLTFAVCVQSNGQIKHKILIIDGQNDHAEWQQSSQLMKSYLEETGLFIVDIARNYPSEGGTLDSFVPDFSRYQVVLSNYNGAEWPRQISKAFEEFVNKGGGLVVVHAANNAFPEWQAYNEMIGVGANRSEKAGPKVYYDEAMGKVMRDNSAGARGYAGAEHSFKVKLRNTNHPVTKGMPDIWLHEKDVLTNEMRGPAQNMEVLATAFSPKDQKGSGKHEPVLMAINYGNGRVFHTTLGHSIEAQKGVGFITLLQRGAEWAASGQVTQQIPTDFPGKDKGSRRP